MARRGSLTIDGAARGNPGPAAAAFVLEEEGKEPVECARKIGRATNNTAEYTALIDGLERALEQGIEEIAVRTDSELVARQLTGDYRIKMRHLMELASEAHVLLRRFGSWSIESIPREENKRADALCRKALGRKKR